MELGKYIKDFIHLLFPNLCKGCNDALLAHEDILCTDCIYHLPLTNFHKDPRNESAQQLWGKTQFHFAISMLYLAKSSRVERLLYRLKYQGEPEIGFFLGKLYANILQDYIAKHDIDYIIPIPLHPKKLRKRGYNQSAAFANGLASNLQIPVLEDKLIRIKHTESQTSKSRGERYDNVSQVFATIDSNILVGKHVLLVDDILTTGATICEASNTLLAAGSQVSIATIARA